MIEASGDQIQRHGKDVHARDEDAQRVVPRKVEHAGEIDKQAEWTDSPLHYRTKKSLLANSLFYTLSNGSIEKAEREEKKREREQ